MTRPVLLNNVDHAELRVRPAHGAQHGDLANQVAIFPTEFEAAQREMPILFRRGADGSLSAVVLTGLDADENLFFEHDRWITRFVPAVQARGPFSIGVTRDAGGAPGEPMIHVDLDDPRVGAGAEGVALFRTHGGNSDYLEAIGGVLQTLYAGIAELPTTVAALEAAGLIESVTLSIEVHEGRRYALPDCYTVSAARLAALDGAALERLHRGGHLALAIFAAASLGNIGRLIELKRRRDSLG